LLFVLADYAAFARSYAAPRNYKAAVAYTPRTCVTGHNAAALMQRFGFNQPAGIFFGHIFPSVYKLFLFMIEK
jgi:hypothetical protein